MCASLWNNKKCFDTADARYEHEDRLRVLRRICGPKRDEVIGKWRKLHNEEINDLYCSPILFG
jgi:hypothetical protein